MTHLNKKKFLAHLADVLERLSRPMDEIEVDVPTIMKIEGYKAAILDTKLDIEAGVYDVKLDDDASLFG